MIIVDNYQSNLARRRTGFSDLGEAQAGIFCFCKAKTFIIYRVVCVDINGLINDKIDESLCQSSLTFFAY